MFFFAEFGPFWTNFNRKDLFFEKSVKWANLSVINKYLTKNTKNIKKGAKFE